MRKQTRVNVNLNDQILISEVTADNRFLPLRLLTVIETQGAVIRMIDKNGDIVTIMRSRDKVKK